MENENRDEFYKALAKQLREEIEKQKGLTITLETRANDKLYILISEESKSRETTLKKLMAKTDSERKRLEKTLLQW